MSQVTIYLEEDTLAAAKAAAARAKVSLSKWFAQHAEAERARTPSDAADFFALIDRLRDPESDKAWDFLLDPLTRNSDLGKDAPRVPFE